FFERIQVYDYEVNRIDLVLFKLVDIFAGVPPGQYTPENIRMKGFYAAAKYFRKTCISIHCSGFETEVMNKFQRSSRRIHMNAVARQQSDNSFQVILVIH